MAGGPRRTRARLWACVYAALFGPGDTATGEPDDGPTASGEPDDPDGTSGSR